MATFSIPTSTKSSSRNQLAAKHLFCLILVAALAGCMHAEPPIPDEIATDGEPEPYLKAQKLYKQGKYEEAAGLFQKAASGLLDPEKITGARYMVALCKYRLGKYSDAILEGRNLIHIDPSSRYVDDAMLVVAKSYSRKENHLQSASYLLRILSTSEDARLVREAEKTLIRMAREKLGSRELQKLAKNFPDQKLTPLLLYQAAKLEIQAGRRSRATEIVKKLTARYSGRQYADKAERMLQSMAGLLVKRTIGLLLPMSGEYLLYGKAVQRGVSLGMDTTMFRVVTYDTKGDPIDALKATRSMIEHDDVLAIIGPVLSMPTTAAAGVANNRGIPLISPTSTEGRISGIGSYIFQLNLSLQSQAEAIADFAVSSLGLFDIAIIYPKDAYGEGLSKIFKDVATSGGGRVLVTVGYEAGTTDFKKQILAVKASSPQAIFIPAYPDDIVLIAPQIRYHLFEGTILGAGGWHSEKVTRLGEKYVEGAVFAAVETGYAGGESSRRFETLYESKFGSKPSRHSALGYDAIQLIQNASRDPQTTSEILMERLSMVTTYWGASGVISLASSDDASGQAKIYTINRGRFKRIK